MIRLLLLTIVWTTPAWSVELFDETKRTTLFAFDNVSIPYTQNLKLEMRQPVRFEGNPVVKRGEPGTSDAHRVQFYGSIIHEGGKYRIW